MMEQGVGVESGEDTQVGELSDGYRGWLDELNRHLPARPETIQARAQSLLVLIEVAAKNKRPDILSAALAEVESLSLPDDSLLIKAYLKASIWDKSYYFKWAAPLNQALNLKEPWACDALLEALVLYPRQLWPRATQLLRELPPSVDDKAESAVPKPLTVKDFFKALGNVLAKSRDFDRLFQAEEIFLSRFSNPVSATQIVMNVWLINNLAGFPQYQELLERAWRIMPWNDLIPEQVKHFFEINSDYIAKASPDDEIWLRFWRNFSLAVAPAILEEDNADQKAKAKPTEHGLKFRETEKECFWIFLTKTMQGGRKTLLSEEIRRRAEKAPKTFVGKEVSDFIVAYGNFLLKSVKREEKAEEDFLAVTGMLLAILKKRGGQNLDLTANLRFDYVLRSCGQLFGTDFLFRLSLPFQNSGYQDVAIVINSKQLTCKGQKSWRQKVEGSEEKSKKGSPLLLPKPALDALIYAKSIREFLVAFYTLPSAKINSHWLKIDAVFENLLGEFVENNKYRDWEKSEFEAYFQREFSPLERLVSVCKGDSEKKNHASEFFISMKAAFADNPQCLLLTATLALKMGFVEEGNIMINGLQANLRDGQAKKDVVEIPMDIEEYLAIMTARAQAWLVKADLF